MNPHQFVPLLGLLVLIGIVAVLARLLGRGPVASFPYERREYLFSAAERSFFGVLEEVFARDYYILGKVRLADVIKPRKGLSNSQRTSAQNRINSKHIDFALCDLGTRPIICVVELDDSSHERAARIKRDEFVVAA